jgi:predicted transcriptional regulator
MAAINGSKHKDTQTEYLRKLAEAGFKDVLTLRRETAAEVLTEARIELVDIISREEVESVRDLARRAERDVSIVSRDLDVLFEAGIIEYEQDGRAKQPVLASETVLVDPVVFEGNVLED